MFTKTITLWWLSALLFAFAVSANEKDPLETLYAEHDAEARVMRLQPHEEVVEYYEKWLARFREAIQAHPDSPSVGRARWNVLGLLNSLGRDAESLALLEEMLAEAGPGPGRVSLLFQAAGSARRAAMAEDNVEALARKSIGFFHEARTLMDAGNAGHVSALRGEAEVQRQLLKDHAKAAELYIQAYEYRSKVPADDRSYLDWEDELSAECLLSNAAVQYARGGDVETALKVFKQLAAIPEARVSRAVYLGDVVLAAGGPGCELICPYIERWLAERLDFPFPQSAMLRLGDAWKLAGKPDKAIAWYERYLEYSATHPDTVIPALYRPALENLAELHDAAGSTARAAELRAEIERLPDPGAPGGQ